MVAAGPVPCCPSPQSVACPFCWKEMEETPFHALLGCPQHSLWHAGFTLLKDGVYFLCIPYRVAEGSMICLVNFLLGLAKTMTLRSHGNQLTGIISYEILQSFHFLVQVHISFEFGQLCPATRCGLVCVTLGH